MNHKSNIFGSVVEPFSVLWTFHKRVEHFCQKVSDGEIDKRMFSFSQEKKNEREIVKNSDRIKIQ